MKRGTLAYSKSKELFTIANGNGYFRTATSKGIRQVKMQDAKPVIPKNFGGTFDVKGEAVEVTNGIEHLVGVGFVCDKHAVAPSGDIANGLLFYKPKQLDLFSTLGDEDEDNKSSDGGAEGTGEETATSEETTNRDAEPQPEGNDDEIEPTEEDESQGIEKDAIVDKSEEE